MTTATSIAPASTEGLFSRNKDGSDIARFDQRLSTLARSPNPRTPSEPVRMKLQQAKAPAKSTIWPRQLQKSAGETPEATTAALARPVPGKTAKIFVPVRHGLRSWIPMVADPHLLRSQAPTSWRVSGRRVGD